MLISFNAFSFEEYFKNDREGESFYSKEYKKKSFISFEAQVNLDVLQNSFNRILEPLSDQNICSVSIASKLRENFNDLKNAALLLRKNNNIDDFILKRFMLLGGFVELPNFELIDIKDGIDSPLANVLKRAKARNFCIEDELKKLIRENFSKDKKQKIKIALNKMSQELGLSSEYARFIQDFVSHNLHKENLTLKEYILKKKVLRTQYPLPLEDEYSDEVTLKKKKTKNSLRMELYQRYSYVQMILMGKIITDLKTHLDSQRIEILVYERDSENLARTISLDPMERFRFAISYLRKEMDGLVKNSLFNGMKPSYEDIILASYELGIISEKEWKEVRELEFIWNPQKTIWEKVAYWGKLALPVVGVLIPQPYGFIATLAVVAIDATMEFRKDGDSDMEHSLFR